MATVGDSASTSTAVKSKSEGKAAAGSSSASSKVHATSQQLGILFKPQLLSNAGIVHYSHLTVLFMVGSIWTETKLQSQVHSGRAHQGSS